MEIVPLRNFFPLKVVPLIELFLYRIKYCAGSEQYKKPSDGKPCPLGTPADHTIAKTFC
jgi:hypothetical protein